MKALEGAFNQEKTLVGAFSVIVQLHRWIVYSTVPDEGADGGQDQLVGGEHPVPAHHAQAGHLPRLLVQHRQLHLRLLQSGAQHLHVKISEEYGELHLDRK